MSEPDILIAYLLACVFTLCGAETRRAQWAIDDVVIAFNDSTEAGFEEDFRGSLRPDVWYMVVNAVSRVSCQSRDNALEFSKNGSRRVANF